MRQSSVVLLVFCPDRYWYISMVLFMLIGMTFVHACKVSPEVRAPFDEHKRAVGNIRQQFHGTSCDSTCNFIADPEVSE